MLIKILLLYSLTSALSADRLKDSLTDCKPVTPSTRCYIGKYRTIDGRCNNRHVLGASFNPLKRLLPARYHDDNHLFLPLGYPHVSHKPFPTPHEVSNGLFRMLEQDSGNSGLVSQLHMTFGQFLDHDLSLTPNAGGCINPKCRPGSLTNFKYPCFPIKFSSTENKGCTQFTRSFAICQKEKGVRQQVNVLTSFIDGSMIYSVNKDKLNRLRMNDGTGRLKVTDKNLLPFDPLATNACKTRGGCFLVGDPRADEHIGLSVFHTLFVREHNRIATELKKNNKHWKGLKLFEESRKIIGAILQHITYTEYVPTLATLSRYRGFRKRADPRIANAFSTAAFRFGHSQVKNQWSQLDNNFNPSSPDIPLRETYFNNTVILDHGIERTMFGLCGNTSEKVDTNFASGIGEKLFVPPGKQGFKNLAAINIQRGRDHGLPGYNEYRRICGLTRSKTFYGLRHEIPTRSVRLAMQKIYKNVDNNIDLFAAGLAEKHLPGKLVGPTFSCIIKKQFEDLRNGDRFYYERSSVFTSQQRAEIRKISMAKILCNNLEGSVSMQRNVFKAQRPGAKRGVCNDIPGINLNAWKEKTTSHHSYYQRYYSRRRRRSTRHRRRVSRRRRRYSRRRKRYSRRRNRHS